MVLAASAACAMAFAFFVAGASTAHADTIDVLSQAERADNPAAITFTIRVRAAAGLKSARVVYKVSNPRADIGGTGEVTVAPGTESDLSFALTTNGNERYIPVGSNFTYHWEFEDTTGAKASSPEKAFVFLDGRYQWRSLTEGTSPPVTVYWYGSNDGRAKLALDATRASLRDTGDLLQAEVRYPIKVIVYGSEREGEAAQRSRGRSFDASVQTGGTRVAPDLILVFEPQVDIVRHEVGHIVTTVAGDGPFGSLPSWIDEGTAVWAQGDGATGSGYLLALGLAIQSNQTLNLRSMQGATNKPEEVNLFYGQAFSTVDYLIKTHGREKYAQLFRDFSKGGNMDEALKGVYGFDQNGLYNEWRKAKSLPAIAFTTPVAGGIPNVEATRPPLGIPTASSGGAQAPAGQAPLVEPDGADPAASGGGVPAAGLAVLGGTVVVALLLGGGALMLLRKRPQASG